MSKAWRATVGFVIATMLFIPQSQADMGTSNEDSSETTQETNTNAVDRVAQDSSVPFLTGYFATYADVPIYSTQPETCSDDTLTQIVSDFSRHFAATGIRCAAVAVDRHRRHWVSDIIPLCSCIDSVQSASDMKCHAIFDVTGAIERLSVAQLHAWCSASPYAYSPMTDGYNFVMDGEPNTVDLSVGDGGVSVSVEVNLPTIEEGAVLIAKGHTGSCFDAKDVFLVNNTEDEFAFSLTCSGGTCRGASTINKETEASIIGLGSIVIYDSLTATNENLAVQPRFLCATMAYTDEAQARVPATDDGDGGGGGDDNGDGDGDGDRVDADDEECNPLHDGKGKHKQSKGAHCSHRKGKAKSVGSLLSETTTSTQHQSSGMTNVVVGVCSVAAVIGFALRKMRRPQEITGTLFSPTKQLNRLEAEGGVMSVAAIGRPEKLPLLEHDDE
eukprot:m.189254 g.189254  ORF g.189254 m.189254 type:complete len:443 (+) comp32369_c1_seq1:191-1519(+)